jgi:hypothetical protein
MEYRIFTMLPTWVKTLGGGDHGFGFLLHPKKMHEKDKTLKR